MSPSRTGNVRAAKRIEERVAADCVVDSCHSGAVGDGVDALDEVLLAVVDDFEATSRTRYRCLALIGYGTDDANAQRARPLGEQEPNTADCRVKEHGIVRLKRDDFLQEQARRYPA